MHLKLIAPSLHYFTFFSSKGGYYVYEATGGGGQDVCFQACAALDHAVADSAAQSVPMASCTDPSFDTSSSAYASWGDPTGGSCVGQGQFTQQSIVPLSK